MAKFCFNWESRKEKNRIWEKFTPFSNFSRISEFSQKIILAFVILNYESPLQFCKTSVRKQIFITSSDTKPPKGVNTKGRSFKGSNKPDLRKNLWCLALELPKHLHKFLLTFKGTQTMFAPLRSPTFWLFRNYLKKNKNNKWIDLQRVIISNKYI